MFCSSTVRNRLEEARAAVEAAPLCPGGFSGRGCIIAGGGPYAVSAYVLAAELRRLGWDYPVQLWHLGPDELDHALVLAFASLDVTCVDACSCLPASPVKRLGGWESKIFSVLHSQFEEVLFLDADSIPAVNPSFLFESREFQETGAVFWPDLTRFRHDATQPRWAVFGVPYRDVPEWETGQFLVNKTRCWKALQLAHYYNANSDYYYQFVHGDKDCCHMAWLKLECPFALMPPAEPRSWGLRHFSQDGELLFQHRTLAKLRLDERAGHPDFQNEAACLSHLQQLQSIWKGFGPHRAPGCPAHEAAAENLTGTYLYAPLNGSPDYITLQFNGAIGGSESIPWNSWRPGGDEAGCDRISLRAADGWQCTARWNGLCYAGNWPMRWDEPFVLLNRGGDISPAGKPDAER